MIHRRLPIEISDPAETAFEAETASTLVTSLPIVILEALSPGPLSEETAVTVPLEMVSSPLSAFMQAPLRGAAVLTVRFPVPFRMRELFSQTIPLPASVSVMLQSPENSIVRVSAPL